MYPDRASFSDRPLPAGAASQEIIEAQMTELVPAVGGEDHVAERRGGDQGAQRFEPADEATAALRCRLPPRAARHHYNDRSPRTVPPVDHDDDIARPGRHPTAY